jgi:hypothetical protein
MKLHYTMAVIALFMVLLFSILLMRYKIDRPKETYANGERERSALISGLTPIWDFLLSKSLLIVVGCILLLFYCVLRLDKSVTGEEGLLRLRGYLKIYRYLLCLGGVLVTIQITLTVLGFFRFQHVGLTHIVHSRLVDGLMGLCVFVSQFLYTRKYISAIQETPDSVIFAAKKLSRNAK